MTVEYSRGYLTRALPAASLREALRPVARIGARGHFAAAGAKSRHIMAAYRLNFSWFSSQFFMVEILLKISTY